MEYKNNNIYKPEKIRSYSKIIRENMIKSREHTSNESSTVKYINKSVDGIEKGHEGHASLSGIIIEYVLEFITLERESLHAGEGCAVLNEEDLNGLINYKPYHMSTCAEYIDTHLIAVKDKIVKFHRDNFLKNKAKSKLATNVNISDLSRFIGNVDGVTLLTNEEMLGMYNDNIMVSLLGRYNDKSMKMNITIPFLDYYNKIISLTSDIKNGRMATQLIESDPSTHCYEESATVDVVLDRMILDRYILEFVLLEMRYYYSKNAMLIISKSDMDNLCSGHFSNEQVSIMFKDIILDGIVDMCS